ncbi:PREDICTED: uncharacterized protein LOC109308599 isoform X2 [Crocodylus porosus]|uniref:uncharacterized protein LOC109308599 isoform X2 n=1 Tax=Crocodylus porosus TaxID=8502 RepID=UPI00093AB646|nr:PREDICTED: uncharacterized protein LOC109308599 isoform X2 [Crocodylus porosus]
MQEKKKKKMKTKASSLPDISILKTFMKTYERHCALSQSSVSVTIKQSLKRCLGNEIALTKFVLTSSENSKGDVQPVSLTPLLRTIRDERYMLGKELCVWGIQLSNQDIANLALLLEQDGCTTYPFCSLEIIHTVIDAWSVERLGAALPVSNLSSIVLDYTKFGDKRINGLVSGLKGNRKLLTLSLCYCNLGPESGTELGPIVAQTAICNLYLNGNNLQCLGALELIKPIAVYANNLARDKETNTMKFSNATGHQMHEVGKGLNVHSAASGMNITPKTTRSNTTESIIGKEKKRKGSKKRKKNPEIGSWLVKLRLADNGIDGRGKGGQNMVLEFTQFLIYLIKYSEHLMELDLDGNAIGELCSADVKDALKERLNDNKVIVKTTFSCRWDCVQKKIIYFSRLFLNMALCLSKYYSFCV